MGLSAIAAQQGYIQGLPAQNQPVVPPGTVDPGAVAPPPPAAPEGLGEQLLTFTHTLANWVGYLFVEYVLKTLLPLDNPASLDVLVGPIGYMLLLTVFLVLAEVAKKVAWIVVVVGWILIVVRVAVEAMQATGPGVGV